MGEAVVNVYEAKTKLSKLLDRVERGEEIVLGRNGRPVARLSAYRTRSGASCARPTRRQDRDGSGLRRHT